VLISSRGSAIRLQSNSIDEVAVRFYGNTAVVTGRATPKGTVNGLDFRPSIRYSRVYVKIDGRWQVVMFQQTRIAQDKPN
jgi:predicted ABC-type sugar transport system permease subunit